MRTWKTDKNKSKLPLSIAIEAVTFLWASGFRRNKNSSSFAFFPSQDRLRCLQSPFPLSLNATLSLVVFWESPWKGNFNNPRVPKEGLLLWEVESDGGRRWRQVPSHNFTLASSKWLPFWTLPHLRFWQSSRKPKNTFNFYFLRWVQWVHSKLKFPLAGKINPFFADFPQKSLRHRPMKGRSFFSLLLLLVRSNNLIWGLKRIHHNVVLINYARMIFLLICEGRETFVSFRQTFHIFQSLISVFQQQ